MDDGSPREESGPDKGDESRRFFTTASGPDQTQGFTGPEIPSFPNGSRSKSSLHLSLQVTKSVPTSSFSERRGFFKSMPLLVHPPRNFPRDPYDRVPI